MAAKETEAELTARIAMLEERLAELETRGPGGGADPFERLLDGFLPADSRAHLRKARKEQLLAARSFIDHWIERIDKAPAERRQRRESISLE
jgi:hypothetical protein